MLEYSNHMRFLLWKITNPKNSNEVVVRISDTSPLTFQLMGVKEKN